MRADVGSLSSNFEATSPWEMVGDGENSRPESFKTPLPKPAGDAKDEQKK